MSTTTPSAPDPSDAKLAATKTRILTHMTADHADSLALFLRYYCKQPVPLPPHLKPNTLQLTDLTLTHLIISHPQGRSLVPLTPPLSSLSESRSRLISMHNACLAGLGLSDLKVTRFALPNKPWQWFTHFCTILSFVSFTLFPSDAFLPGSGSLAATIWSVGGLFPWLARLTSVLCKPTLVFMVVVHGAECVWFQRTRVQRYWVAVGSAVWWAWMVCVFSGGVAGQWRFDDLVREMREEKDKVGKH